MFNLDDFIKKNKLNVVVIPNASRNALVCYDKTKNFVKFSITAPPEKGKANKELLKFLKKKFKIKGKIVKGSKSKEKVLEIL